MMSSARTRPRLLTVLVTVGLIAGFVLVAPTPTRVLAEPAPTIYVQDGLLGLENFTDTDVRVEISNPTGDPMLAADTIVPVGAPINPADYDPDPNDGIDVQLDANWDVTVTGVQSGISKHLHVVYLFAMWIDAEIDTVGGDTEPYTTLVVEAFDAGDNPLGTLTVTTIGDTNQWQADFTGIASLQDGDWFRALIIDDESDYMVDDYSRGRGLGASLTGGGVWGSGWPHEAGTADVWIDDVDGLGLLGPFPVDIPAQTDGFGLLPDEIGNPDLTPGDVITIDDGIVSLSHTLTSPLTANLSEDGLFASGEKPENEAVSVLITGPGCPERHLAGVETGPTTWELDLSPHCPDGLFQHGFVSARHNVEHGWTTAEADPVEPDPGLDANLGHSGLGTSVEGWAWHWDQGSEVQLQLFEPLGADPISTTEVYPSAHEYGSNFWTDFDTTFAPGDRIVATGMASGIVREVTVQDIRVTSVDRLTGIVTGTTTSTLPVNVVANTTDASGNYPDQINRFATVTGPDVDGVYDWTVDFTTDELPPDEFGDPLAVPVDVLSGRAYVGNTGAAYSTPRIQMNTSNEEWWSNVRSVDEDVFLTFDEGARHFETDVHSPWFDQIGVGSIDPDLNQVADLVPALGNGAGWTVSVVAADDDEALAGFELPLLTLDSVNTTTGEITGQADPLPLFLDVNTGGPDGWDGTQIEVASSPWSWTSSVAERLISAMWNSHAGSGHELNLTYAWPSFTYSRNYDEPTGTWSHFLSSFGGAPLGVRGSFPYPGTVTITADDPATPADPDHELPIATYEHPGEGVGSGFEIDLFDALGIAPEDVEPDWAFSTYAEIDGVPMSKTLVIDQVSVDGVDAEAGTAWGTCSPGEWEWIVQVEHDGWGENLYPECMPDGTWSVGFDTSEPVSQVWASYQDGDLDVNTAAFYPIVETGEDPWISAIVKSGTVQFHGDWSGDPMTITIDGFNRGTYNYDDCAQGCDWLPVNVGSEISVSDGTTAKELTVTNLSLLGVDPVASIIDGTSSAGLDVEINWDGTRTVPDNGTGIWTADFSLTNPFSGQAQGWASQTDDEGDQTWLWWSTPRMHVEPLGAVVGQGGWYEGDTVVVTTFDPDNEPLNTFYVIAGSRDIDQDSWGIDNVGEFGIGYSVVAQDRQTTRNHDVRPLTIGEINTDSDTTSGTTTMQPDDRLQVQADHCSRDDVSVTAGNYTADFSVPGAQPHEQDTCDLNPGSSGDVLQYDDDGDFTILWWNVPEPPSFSVEPPHGVAGYGEQWPEGATVDIIVSSDEDVVNSTLFSTEATVTHWGPSPWDQGFDVGLDGQFDIQSGHIVTVMVNTDVNTPPEIHKVLEVADLRIDDPGNDTGLMNGHAPPDSQVEINLGNSYQNAWRNVTAASDTGYWSADLANLDPGVDGDGTIDAPYEPGTHINVQVRDEDGDATRHSQNVPGEPATPRQLEVYPDLDLVGAWGDDDVDLDLSVHRAGSEVYTATSQWGFALWEDGFDLLPGDLVTVSDGETTKDHLVRAQSITELLPDPVNRISGTAPEGTTISIRYNTIASDLGDDNLLEDGIYTVGASNLWTHDFPDGFPVEAGIAIEVSVRDQPNADNDSTIVVAFVPAPTITAWPQPGSAVEGRGWPSGAPVDISVGNGVDTFEVSPSPVPDRVGPFPWDTAFMAEFYNQAEENWQLEPGNVITATTADDDGDGQPDLRKDLTVADLSLEAADIETGFFDGHAAPDETVNVNAGNEHEHAWRNVTAAPDTDLDPGYWSADLSTLWPDDDGDGEMGVPFARNTNYGAQVYDDDGDSTSFGGCHECDDGGEGPGELHLHAMAYGNEWLGGEGLPSGMYVIQIEGTDECSNLVYREGSEFHVDGAELCEDGDLKPGHHVVVSAVAEDGLSPGRLIAEFTIDGVVISGANVGSDTVWGLGTDGKPVTIGLFDESTEEPVAWRTVDLADGASEWSVDFTTAPDPETEDNWGAGALAGRSVWAAQFDAHGHTESDWVDVEPHIYVNRITDDVVLENWPTGGSITLEVFASDTVGALPLYAESAPAPGPYYVFSNHTELGGFDLLAGQYVVATAGAVEVAHSVAAIGVESFDFVEDSYDGIATAEPGSTVRTGVWYEQGGHQEGSVEFLATPEWTADFTEQGLDFSATNRIEGYVAEFDLSGNATFYEFAAEYEELTNDNGTATSDNGGVTVTGLEGSDNITMTETDSSDVGDGFQTVGTSVDVDGTDDDGNPVVRDFEAGDQPLVLTLRILGDDMPDDLSLEDILVFRNWAEVPNCPDVLQSNNDFPCVSTREWVDGDVVLTVQTLAFSIWTMALRLVDIAGFSATTEPIAVGSPVDASGSLDVSATDFTAVIHWDDGSCNVVGVDDAVFHTTHGYADPGVYAPVLEVYAGSRTCADVAGEDPIDTTTYRYVVVYDPDGGFVTGGGWIDSPAGAYTPDPELTGRANFGFVAKYKKGKGTPGGNTNFQFQTAGLHFQSTAYDWLVITGGEKAKYKGVGTINGEGTYGFMLTAMDSDDGDTFRIKIWDKTTGDTVYDNWSIDGGDSYDGTALGGGSIVVHTK